MQDIDVTILFGKTRKGRQIYRLKQKILFKGWEHEVLVDEGFKSDLVSLPRILRVFLSPTGRWAYASIVHDFLYRTHYLSRKEADTIFYKIMKDCGVSTWKRASAYYLVRWFGFIVYNKNKDIVDNYRKYGYVKNITR